MRGVTGDSIPRTGDVGSDVLTVNADPRQLNWRRIRGNHSGLWRWWKGIEVGRVVYAKDTHVMSINV